MVFNNIEPPRYTPVTEISWKVALSTITPNLAPIIFTSLYVIFFQKLLDFQRPPCLAMALCSKTVVLLFVLADKASSTSINHILCSASEDATNSPRWPNILSTIIYLHSYRPFRIFMLKVFCAIMNQQSFFI